MSAGLRPGAPRAAAARDPQWKTICRVDDIPRLGARRVSRPNGADVAMFRTADDRVFALLDRCPHKGGPLSQGIVFGDSVACPLHNWTIGLGDGCAAAPDVGCVQRFSVRVEHGTVALDLVELAHAPSDADPGTASHLASGHDAAGVSVESPAKAAA